MAPLPHDHAHELDKRLIFWGYGPNDGTRNNNWYNWGRWVLLGIIVGVAVLFFLALQCASCRRVRNGQRPIRGTQWMVPPSYYQSEQQYNSQGYNLPTYKPEPGEGDMGHYQQDGQFVPNTNTGPTNEHFAPPNGPPPGHADQYGPPPGPPPGHGGSYGPPAGPPPGHGDAPQAPPMARVKN